jgi:hypothetical protein
MALTHYGYYPSGPVGTPRDGPQTVWPGSSENTPPTDQSTTTIDPGGLRSVSPTGHEPFVALQEPPTEPFGVCTL